MTDIALETHAVERRARKRRNGGHWLLGALALGGLSAAAWVFATRANDNAARQTAGATEIDLLQVRVDMTRPALDEVTVRMLEPFGITSSADVEAAVAAREAATSAGRVALTEISEGKGDAAVRAQQVLEFLDRAPLGETVESLYQVTDIASFAQFEAVPPPLPEPNQNDALRELAFLDQPLLLSFHEVVTAHWSLQDLEADAIITDFYDDQVPFVEDEGGYLGPDPDLPLVDGWILTDTARVHYSGAVEGIERITAASGLWASDQWVREWANGPLTEPPHDLATLATDVEDAIDETRVLVDAPIAAEGDALASDANRSEFYALLGKAAGLLTAIAAAVVGLLGAKAVRKDTFHLRNRANTDALTGAGNRNMLDDEIAHRLGDDRFTHHALVMIDMDRFKVVNDTHGHATGDQLLRHVSKGLEGIVSSDVARAGTVVRLGGDEFCFSLHNQNPIDGEALRAMLDALRTSTIAADDETVALDFSYGIATGNGAPTLRDLMDAADLAAYEQKAERAAQFAAQDLPTAPPVA